MAQPTADEVARFFKLNEQHKELERQARLLESEIEPIKTKLFTFIQEKGGVKKTKLIGGFVCSIQKRAGRVAWKEEFITAVGSEAAGELQKKCPQVDFLNVEPASE